jgi:prepilin-type N-terminal cleavage/methylation domain-containing protein
MKKQFLGFTLSELLVSLAVIGLIAAFAVPKIIGDTAKNQNKMQLKEGLTAIESIAMQGYADEEIVEGSPASMIAYVTSRIRNVARVCPNNARAQGCAGPNASLHWGDGAVPGIRLNNGSLILFATWPDCNEATVGTTCSYVMVYDSTVNAGQPWNPRTNSTHLPFIIREGNPRGGLGTLLKNDYIYGGDSRWLYQ